MRHATPANRVEVGQPPRALALVKEQSGKSIYEHALAHLVDGMQQQSRKPAICFVEGERKPTRHEWNEGHESIPTLEQRHFLNCLMRQRLNYPALPQMSAISDQDHEFRRVVGVSANNAHAHLGMRTQ